ncbi:MAG: hypothetical protein GX130_06145 [Candidatus Hydrogenedens sp.]|nr:hypothetical protein [Candidatus Hydrogenedens sp.]
MTKGNCICPGTVWRYSWGVTVAGLVLLTWSFVSLAEEKNVGHLDPGTADYPNAALKRLDGTVDFRDDRDVICTLIDDEKRYAYLGTGGKPARVIKMDLGTEEEDMPVHVATLLLEGDEAELSCGVIDSEAGFAWFGTDTNPSKIIKIALGEGSAAPERLGVTVLPLSEPHVCSAVLDRSTNTALFGTGREPATVVKMDLRSGYQPPVRVDSVVVAETEKELSCAVFDPLGGYAYFGASQQNRVYKIFPGAAGEPPSVVGFVSGITKARCAVLDPEKGRAWFGSFTESGKIFKIDLGEGAASPQLIGSTTLDSGEGYLRAAVLDAAKGEAYFSTEKSGHPSKVVKVSLGEEERPFERMYDCALESGETLLNSAVADPEKGYAWFSTLTDPARVIKMKLVDGYEPERLGSTELTNGENNYHVTLMDSQARYAWTGTNTSPGRIIKFALYEGKERPRRLGRIDLAPDEEAILCGVLDESRGYAWFGTYDSTPGKVVMVALGEGDAPPERHGVLILNSEERGLRSVAMDPARCYAYFGTSSTPPGIIKVALGTEDELPTRVAAVTFGTGEDAFSCAAYDEVNDLLYFGSEKGYILRVNPGAGNSPPVIENSYNTHSPAFCSVLLDPVAGYAWFGNWGTPGRIMKVDIDPARSFEPINSLELLSGEYGLYAAVRDP